jgi:hypothetical protein
MPGDEFWSIVGRVHAGAGFDMEKKCALLADELRKLPPEEIISWDSHYDCQCYRANTRDIHAINVLFCGCTSGDAFLDFRCDLVSCGRSLFEAVMKDPDSLGDLIGSQVDIGIEGYQYVACQVYGEMTGQEMDVPLLVDRPVRRGEKWHTRKDLERRFPRMWARFSGGLLID